MSNDSFPLMAFHHARQMQVTHVLLALGSNYQPEKHLSFAINHLQSLGDTQFSSVFINPDYTATDENPKPDYSNQCVIIAFYSPPILSSFIDMLKALELGCHRNKSSIYDVNSQRIVSLDIDVLAIQTSVRHKHQKEDGWKAIDKRYPFKYHERVGVSELMELTINCQQDKDK